MTQADVVITGTVLTVDDARPTAEALAVADQ
jgi:predicted amidohydrolase YtcJ